MNNEIKTVQDFIKYSNEHKKNMVCPFCDENGINQPVNMVILSSYFKALRIFCFCPNNKDHLITLEAV